MKISAPTPEEYAPFYARYVETARNRHCDEVLNADVQPLEDVFDRLTESAADGAYAPGKWTVKEVLIHCIDAERIFAARALRLLRGDASPLPGYDQDPYVPASRSDLRTLAHIRAEWASVRAATVSLFRYSPPENLTFIGTADGSPVSARALAYIIPGHYLHHIEVLNRKYGLG